MTCPQQAQFRTRRELWGDALQLLAQTPLGDDEVDLPQELQGLFQRNALRRQPLRELPQDLAHFALFFGLDMEQLIVEFDDTRRLYVHGCATGRLPMHDAA